MLEILSILGIFCSILGGIEILVRLVRAIKKLKQQKEPPQHQLSAIEEQETSKEQTEVEIVVYTEQQISQRLNKLIDLFNQNRSYDKITVSELAEFLDYERTSDLEKYFRGLEEPLRSEKEHICDCLGVNPEWLKHGKGEAFNSQEEYRLYAFDYKKIIADKSPEKIIFVRSKASDGAIIIVLRINKYKYICLPETWNISGEVGGTGQNQILSFYYLVKYLQKLKNLDFTCFYMQGIHLEEEVFNDLICGRIYPGSIITSYNDTWWDDLTDIHHSWAYASSYEEMHGKNFIDAQNIIKYKLECRQSR